MIKISRRCLSLLDALSRLGNTHLLKGRGLSKGQLSCTGVSYTLQVINVQGNRRHGPYFGGVM